MWSSRLERYMRSLRWRGLIARLRALLRGNEFYLIPLALLVGFAVGAIVTAMSEIAQLSHDDVVLITAAAGGLGSLLVQAARNAGAVAVGVAGGPAKTARVLALGADVATDYLQPAWPEQVRDALRVASRETVIPSTMGRSSV